MSPLQTWNVLPCTAIRFHAENPNMANHTVVSQWESKEDKPAGMDYNTEVVLRLWMASKCGDGERMPELLESGLKKLSPAPLAALEVSFPTAA